MQFLELKYVGLIINLNYHSESGGDRMNIFYHNFSDIYLKYLSPLKHTKEPLKSLEVGILKGTGLAVWSDYFDEKQIYGFDYDLRNFKQNKNNLIELDALRDGMPIIMFYDQFANNSAIPKDTFGEEKLDVFIDDAFQSEDSIIHTFDELQPYLALNLLYFIEDIKLHGKNYKKNILNIIFIIIITN